jgi:hypothetical protein
MLKKEINLFNNKSFKKKIKIRIRIINIIKIRIINIIKLKIEYNLYNIFKYYNYYAS